MNETGGMGGGPTFAFHLADNLPSRTNNPDEANIVLIPGATMVDRVTVEKYYGHKKIVLRVDNQLKHSRNRATGMSRLYDYAQMADAIVYQSQWARNYLREFLKSQNTKEYVILNGSDEKIFYPRMARFRPRKRYLYVASSTDESKGWVIAHQKFQEIHKEENAEIWLVGKFDDKVRDYGFDFFNGEKWEYKGVVKRPKQMARIYRACDALLYSYFCDACSNCLNEAMMCGLEIKDCYQMSQTGGASEQLDVGPRRLRDMVQEYEEMFEDVWKLTTPTPPRFDEKGLESDSAKAYRSRWRWLPGYSQRTR